MTYFIHALNLAATYIGPCLEVLLLVLAVRKSVYRTLLFLAIYIFLLVPRDIAWLCIWHSKYFLAPWASYFYYISDEVLTLLRLLVIVEIGIRTLRGYPVVWHFAWRILTLIGSAVLLWGTIAAIRSVHPTQQLILTIQEFLNSTQALLLLLVLAIGLYYRIDVPQLYRSIVTGICIYSAIQIFNSEIGRYIANPTNSAWDFIRRYSFEILEIVWLRALWKWSGAPPRSNQLISQAEYDDLSPQIHDRLRKINDRLTGLSK